MKTNNISGIDTVEILDRSVPPKAGKPRDINFPEFFETKTTNGITILVIEDKRLPLITTRFVFRSGAYLDHFFGENKSGLASVTSELLTKGTGTRSATQIAEDVDYLGASLSSGSDYNASYVSSYSLKKYSDNIFDIISDVIINPDFAEDEIKRSAEQRINSLLSMRDEGDYLADRTFKKVVFDKTPYQYPVEGIESSIRNINRDDIFSYYKKVFVPSNLIVAFVGDITPEEAVAKINEQFSGWSGADAPVNEIIVPAHKDKTGVYLTGKKGAVQSSLKVGHLGIQRNNPDFIAVSVMNTMLGGFFTSRLNKNLREVNGYTYGVRSMFSSNLHSGDFSVVTEVKNNITANTVTEILKEINEIRNNFIQDMELQNVKNYISGSFPLQLETPNAIASKVINLKLNDLEDGYYNTYIKKVNELTKEEIKEAANKYLHPDKLVLSIAGNVNEIKSEMEKFGEVEITVEDK
ncbi:MAG TPA: pitrilysin family protein [Ignavibacteria bacterium]|mgnify:CR=1 FL=1|nr:pitrilysin family protein [Ignavibacteria bacterium]HMR41846.1 pitrilysin family protein [Ignavibacteria bacterium]